MNPDYAVDLEKCRVEFFREWLDRSEFKVQSSRRDGALNVERLNLERRDADSCAPPGFHTGLANLAVQLGHPG
jgi:hypothetical protein